MSMQREAAPGDSPATPSVASTPSNAPGAGSGASGAAPIARPKLGLYGNWILLRGKLRRFYYGHFRKNYVAAQAAKREGECIRCGACCEILFKCPFASECEEGSTCKIYATRPVNCRVFPMDKQDLAEINLMRPDRPCSYSFKD